MHEEPDDHFMDDDEDDGELEDAVDCHMDPSTGQCGKAGSEECDFECPYRAEADRICARIAARRR
jgi:hypothetical protein